MPYYEILNRKHACYDSTVYSELSDLYCGGYQILRNANKYLPKVVGEHDVKYSERLKQASYIPYFAEIVDYFVSNLFNQDLTVTPPGDSENPDTPGTTPDEKYYGEFYRNADRAGSPFAEKIKEAFRDGILYQRGVICVDFPSKENNAESRAEEEALGLSDAYISTLDSKELINWKKDIYGNFQWCILKCTEEANDDPLSENKEFVDTFKLWYLTSSGVVAWKEFSITYNENSPPHNKTEVPQTDGGETTFKNIPIIVLEVPEGLWVGNKVGPMAKEHFRRRSILQAAESRSMNAIPVIGLAPETPSQGGALPAEAAQDPHRGEDPHGRFAREGFLVLGSEDKYGYLEPTGNSYTIVDRELAELRDEMFRVVHQMSQGIATSSGGAIRRSGLSKIKDAEATVIILGEYGRLVRRYAQKVYKTISDARGEDVNWVGRGLDTFEVDNRMELIDEATKVDMISIPSQTFKTEYKTQLALQILPSVQTTIQQAIREEIAEGVEKESDLMSDFMKQGMLPQMIPQSSGPIPSDSPVSASQSAENNSRGQAGQTGPAGSRKNVPKQNKPGNKLKSSFQPRSPDGKFGAK